MLEKNKQISLNFKIFGFLFIPLTSILISIPFFSYIGNVKAGIEFQWDQDSGFRRLNWFQKENKRNFRNKIYFFIRPSDRNNDLLKIDLIIPKTFNKKLETKNISFCKVKIGGFDSRTKCLETIPADLEIKTDEASLKKLSIYPYSPIPFSKDSYAIVIKTFNPKRSGLYQFHSYGQPKGSTLSSYLGSWTIMID
tara:strand:- start:169 stop:753 length:585 start_codon:yes stop_codon:yes gene_type:complete